MNKKLSVKLAKELLSLLDDGILIRNTENDDNHHHYFKSGLRICNLVSDAHLILTGDKK